jgi:hypothetical protein
MKNFFISGILLIVSFYSCNFFENTPAVSHSKDTVQLSQSNKDKETHSYEDFQSIYREFFTALKEKDELTLNRFIHPDYGLYIIESNGAMPQVKYIKHLGEYRFPDGTPFFIRIDTMVFGMEIIKVERLPAVNCDLPPDFYERQGMFTTDTNMLRNLELWKYIHFENENQLKKFKSLILTINKTVLNTSNYIFYFSYLQNRWYLTFLDVRRPCEA